MRFLAERVSRKTGLSKTESASLIKVFSYEIAMGLKENGYVEIEGLGTLYRSHSDKDGILILKPEGFLAQKLAEPETGERKDEIIFE